MNKNELRFDEIVGLNNRELESRTIVIEFPAGRSVEYVDDSAALGKIQEPRITSATIIKMRRKPARRYGDLSIDILVKVDDNPNIFKTYITQFDMTERLYNRPEPDVKVYELA